MALDRLSQGNSSDILKLVEAQRPEETVLGDFSLRSLGGLIKRLKAELDGYAPMPRFPDPKLCGLNIRSFEDLDEKPRLFVYQIWMDLGGKRAWDLLVMYNETNQSDAGLVRESDITKATAYKMPRKIGTRTTYLGVSGFYYNEIEERPGEDAGTDLMHIETLLDHLRSVSSSLDDWVASGMNMMVFCARCKRTGTITNDSLKGLLRSGKDLERLKKDLVCEGCRQNTDMECISCSLDGKTDGCPYCLGKASNMVRPDPA